MKFARNKSLKKISTFCIGGKAEYFLETASPLVAQKAISFAEEKKLPWHMMGEGSNMLFPDGLVKGLLICVRGGKIEKKENSVIVSAGVPLSKFVTNSLRRGLRGLECLSGIPGTVAGAVYGNAGAYGHSISESVVRVEVWEEGKVRWIKRDECDFGYRESGFKLKRCALLRVEFRMPKGNKKELLEKSKRIIAERAKKYPAGLKCPGSFFKNPIAVNIPKNILRKIDATKIIGGKIPAGYLLEAVGANGMRVGNICVAEYHGNLFINMGKGTEAQVKKIVAILKDRVKHKFGIVLTEEVRTW